MSDECSVCLEDKELFVHYRYCRHTVCTDCFPQIVGNQCQMCRATLRVEKQEVLSDMIQRMGAEEKEMWNFLKLIFVMVLLISLMMVVATIKSPYTIDKVEYCVSSGPNEPVMLNGPIGPIGVQGPVGSIGPVGQCGPG
jgi:hypothetical protein